MADDNAVYPTTVCLHQASKTLEIHFSDAKQFTLPAEYLRVHSPSAEVRGHGAGQGILQTGKRDVGLLAIEAVGHYALKICFDDGHSSGLYTWSYLYDLGVQYHTYWQRYLAALEQAGKSRGEKDSLL